MDKDKADKIFDNLFSNAVKYTPVGGEITVRVRQTETKIYLEIKDSGIGIPRKAQRHIFSNFYRAENAVNSKEAGSGIGLLLTRRLVKLHKGEISFVSSEGEGSTFFLTFRQGNRHLSRYVVPDSAFNASAPAAELVAEPVDTLDLPDTEENPQETNSAKERIMLVEDNDELRFYLRKTFEQAYHVIDKPDAASCLEYLSGKSVDLVISDVMMPGMQGDELCRRIKENLATSHIPVILLTAKTEKDAILEGLESGADDYLTKPFDTEILKTKIKGVLQNRKIMRQHFLSRSLELSPVREEEQKAKEEASLDLLSPIDKGFLEQCTQFVRKNLETPEFNINRLCRELGMSRTIFYEKLKALTGQAPNTFVKLIRMKEAAELLKQQVPIQDVAYMTGFTDAKYFSTVFKKHFGVSPSKFLG